MEDCGKVNNWSCLFASILLFIQIADGVTTDKQCVYFSAFKELEMPDSGAIVKLRVVNVVSVNTFYSCLINSYSEGKEIQNTCDFLIFLILI